jgi:hypothetical protein
MRKDVAKYLLTERSKAYRKLTSCLLHIKSEPTGNRIQVMPLYLLIVNCTYRKRRDIFRNARKPSCTQSNCNQTHSAKKLNFTLQQAMKTQSARTEVQLYSFFNLGARWGGWSASRSGRFTPGNKTRYPLYRRLAGPRGQSGKVRKISPQPRFDPRTVQPVASRYTDWAAQASDFRLYRFPYQVRCFQQSRFLQSVCFTGIIFRYFSSSLVTIPVDPGTTGIIQYFLFHTRWIPTHIIIIIIIVVVPVLKQQVTMYEGDAV